MEWRDLPREKFLENQNTKKVIEIWDRDFGGYEFVRDNILSHIFSPSQFEWVFPREYFSIESSVLRYHICEYLKDAGLLDQKNLEGDVLDIGSHLGAAVDALAAYGGYVRGTDCGKFSFYSPSNRDIGFWDGKSALRMYHYGSQKLSMMTCFNVDWVEGMSENDFGLHLYFNALPALADNGEILFTFFRDYKTANEALRCLPDSRIVELPEKLSHREKYAFVAKNVVYDVF